MECLWKKYYLAIWATYGLFLCCFIIISTLNDNISWFYQKIFLNITIILGFWNLIFEFRQFLFSWYFTSIWNYFDSNTNMFTQFSSALIATYYMTITGDSTPISSWISSENAIIMLLMIMVSFFILIYLVNLFIGILSELISNEKNDIAYLVLKSEIIEEIETFYLLPHQRRKENWFPSIIFYECDTIKLRKHIKDIQSDKWAGYQKPYFSQNLKEVLQLDEE
ncbi:hypothetical protein C2G38_2138227 [Gigaspora rosea]|uniref:Ion transport domain-containing protein n=1 Tax=Gigaspora rosea TaxID=44941 RepID=A0A397VVK9_9GLOM|nr:hypothetical protein C2G38_2138227 [Gigaspora rosea]